MNPELCQVEPACLQLHGESSSYKALVRPLLEYASPVWDSHTISCISSIEKVQGRAAKWAMQDYKLTSSVTAMLEELAMAISSSMALGRRPGSACCTSSGFVS